MSFVSPLLRGGQIGVATSDEGPPSHETRLKSALGLRSTNATKGDFETALPHSNGGYFGENIFSYWVEWSRDNSSENLNCNYAFCLSASYLNISTFNPSTPRAFCQKRIFWTSGLVQHRKSAIHKLPVTLRMLRVNLTNLIG